MKRILTLKLLIITMSLCSSAQIVNNKDYHFTEEQEKIIFHSYYRDVALYVGSLDGKVPPSDGLYFCRGMGPHYYCQLFLLYNKEIIFFRRRVHLNPQVIIGEMCQIIQDRNILSEEIRNDMYRSVYRILVKDIISNPEKYKETKCKYVDTAEVELIYKEIMKNPKDIPYKLPWIMLLDLNSDESSLLLGKICGLKEEDIRREYDEEEDES